jgi:hypothetical protein
MVEPEAASFAEVLMAVADKVSAVIDAVRGYQERLIAAGFNETAAEMMAVHYHSMIMEMLINAGRRRD